MVRPTSRKVPGSPNELPQREKRTPSSSEARVTRSAKTSVKTPVKTPAKPSAKTRRVGKTTTRSTKKVQHVALVQGAEKTTASSRFLKSIQVISAVIQVPLKHLMNIEASRKLILAGGYTTAALFIAYSFKILKTDPLAGMALSSITALATYKLAEWRQSDNSLHQHQITKQVLS